MREDPAAFCPVGPRGVAQAEKEQLQMARVLVVEDDQMLREVLVECLQFDPYEVCTASDLLQGVELLQREPFDLVLSDLFTAVFSPAALLELDAFTTAAPATPVVVATAHAKAAACNPAQYGLAAIILKPFALADLLACLRGVLAEQQQRLRSLQTTTEQAWDQHRLAQERIATSSALLRRVQTPKPDPGTEH